jgi:mandelate racemase
VLKLNRPVVARIATLTEWPLILIDLYTEEGVIGCSYLEPYIRRSMRYLIPALHDLGELLRPPARSDRILRSGPQVAAFRWL